jgi:hypothetical protein
VERVGALAGSPPPSADLGEQVAGEHGADPVDRLQREQPLVFAGEQAQLGIDRVDLHLERTR